MKTSILFLALLTVLGSKHSSAQSIADKLIQTERGQWTEHAEQGKLPPNQEQKDFDEIENRQTFVEAAHCSSPDGSPTKTETCRTTEPHDRIGLIRLTRSYPYGPHSEPVTLNFYKGHDDEEISPQ